MLWPARFTSLNVKRTRDALALTLIAAAACDERGATAPQHTATQRASTDTSTRRAAGVSVSPGDLYFANQAVGTSSAPQVDTVRNTGTEPVALSFLGVTGPFTITQQRLSSDPRAKPILHHLDRVRTDDRRTVDRVVMISSPTADHPVHWASTAPES